MQMKVFVLVVLMFGSTACMKHTVTPGAPVQPAPSVDQQIYANLLTAQTAIEGLQAQPTLVAPIKTQLNQAVASYNVAEKAFTDYEAAKKANLADPNDVIKIQQMVLSLQTQINALGQVFKKGN